MIWKAASPPPPPPCASSLLQTTSPTSPVQFKGKADIRAALSLVNFREREMWFLESEKYMSQNYKNTALPSCPNVKGKFKSWHQRRSISRLMLFLLQIISREIWFTKSNKYDLPNQINIFHKIEEIHLTRSEKYSSPNLKGKLTPEALSPYFSSIFRTHLHKCSSVCNEKEPIHNKNKWKCLFEWNGYDRCHISLCQWLVMILL